MPTASRDGKVITFYSYKGGTGRSLMLANVAWILASNGRRVLAVDWDLEAPGLHRYFEPFLPDKDLTSTDGVIDLVIEFAAEAVERGRRDGGEADVDVDWYSPYADIRRYAGAIEWDFGQGGAIHFVSAGRQGVSYATRVNSFDWEDFYNDFGGGVFLDSVRSGMKRHYDYILIDSRTGVSDTSGVCTVQMPDVLVVCFTLNNQGIQGASSVARSVLEQRQPRIRILPVPMRIENSEKEKLEARRAYARELFAGFPADPAVRDTELYWADVEVVYVPFYAYDEILATIADEPDQHNSILAAAERLTGYVAGNGGNPLRLVAPRPEERARVKAMYARRGRPAPGEQYDVFLSYAPSDGEVVERIGAQLRSKGLNPAAASWLATPGRVWREAVGDAIGASRCCAIFVGAKGLDSFQRQDLANAMDRAKRDEDFRVFAVLLPGVPEPFESTVLPPDLARRGWVDLTGGVDGPAALDPLVQAVSPAPDVPATAEPAAPYPGPLPFQESQAEFFFGRDVEVTRMLESLADKRFVALVGASGSGKTSLVRAGVIPALRAGRLQGSDKWIIERTRPGASPLEALRRSLEHHGVAPTVEELKADEKTLHEAVERALGSQPPSARSRSLVPPPPATVDTSRFLLVVDQAEELFSAAHDADARRAFIRNLQHAVTVPGGRTSVIFILRLDAYPATAEYPELGGLISAGTLLLPPLDEERLRAAITQPADRAGLTLEPGLVERMVQDVQSEPGALPLLQLALLGLWERRSGSLLTQADYQAVGGVARSAVVRAESIVAAFTPTEEKIAKRVFLRLSEPGDDGPDTRRRATRAELLGSGSEREAVRAVVEKLISANLLVTSSDRATGNVFVDVAHEALIRTWPRVVQWIEEDRQALRVQRRITSAMTEWQAAGRDESFLLRGASLQEALELEKKGRERFSESEIDFVAASLRRQRRARLATVLSTTVTFVFTLLIVLGLVLEYLI